MDTFFSVSTVSLKLRTNGFSKRKILKMLVLQQWCEICVADHWGSNEKHSPEHCHRLSAYVLGNNLIILTVFNSVINIVESARS